VTYSEAFRNVVAHHKDVVRRYNDRFTDTADLRKHGETLTAAQKAMAVLQADAEQCRRLASFVLDAKARERATRLARTGTPNPQAYRLGLTQVRNELPNLWRASEDGFVAGSDYGLLALLVPSVGDEVQRGNFSKA
jgi:hypothetical protein